MEKNEKGANKRIDLTNFSNLSKRQQYEVVRRIKKRAEKIQKEETNTETIKQKTVEKTKQKSKPIEKEYKFPEPPLTMQTFKELEHALHTGKVKVDEFSSELVVSYSFIDTILNSTTPYKRQIWNMFISAVQEHIKANYSVLDAFEKVSEELISEGYNATEIRTIAAVLTEKYREKFSTFEKKDEKKSTVNKFQIPKLPLSDITYQELGNLLATGQLKWEQFPRELKIAYNQYGSEERAEKQKKMVEEGRIGKYQ